MAKNVRNYQAEDTKIAQNAAPAPAPLVLDEELQVILYNPTARVKNLQDLVEAKLILGLCSTVPAPLDGDRVEADTLRRFLTRVEGALVKLRERVESLRPGQKTGATPIAEGIPPLLKDAASELASAASDLSPCFQIQGLAQGVRAAAAAVVTLADGFRVEQLKDEAVYGALEEAPSNRRLAVESFLHVLQPKEQPTPTIHFDGSLEGDQFFAKLVEESQKLKSEEKKEETQESSRGTALKGKGKKRRTREEPTLDDILLDPLASVFARARADLECAKMPLPRSSSLLRSEDAPKIGIPSKIEKAGFAADFWKGQVRTIAASLEAKLREECAHLPIHCTDDAHRATVTEETRRLFFTFVSSVEDAVEVACAGSLSSVPSYETIQSHVGHACSEFHDGNTVLPTTLRDLFSEIVCGGMFDTFTRHRSAENLLKEITINGVADNVQTFLGNGDILPLKTKADIEAEEQTQRDVRDRERKRVEDQEALEKLKGPVLQMAKNICTDHVCRLVCSAVLEEVTGSSEKKMEEVLAISDHQFKVAWMDRIAHIVSYFVDEEVIFEGEDRSKLEQRLRDVFLRRNPIIRIVSRLNDALRDDPAFTRYSKKLLECARGGRPETSGLETAITHPKEAPLQEALDARGIAYTKVLGNRREGLLPQEREMLRSYCRMRLGDEVATLNDDAIFERVAAWGEDGTLERIANEVNKQCSGGDTRIHHTALGDDMMQAVQEWKREQGLEEKQEQVELSELVQNLTERWRGIGEWINTWKEMQRASETSGRAAILEMHRNVRFLLEGRFADTQELRPPDPMTVPQASKLIAHLEKAVPLIQRKGSALVIDRVEFAKWTQDAMFLGLTVNETEEPDEKIDSLSELRVGLMHSVRRIEKQLIDIKTAPSRISEITAEIAELNIEMGAARNERRIADLRFEQLRLQELMGRRALLERELLAMQEKQQRLSEGINRLISSLDE